MLVYKFTDQNDETKNGTKWGPGISHAVEGPLVLCENGIHAYIDPLLAVLHNPIHGKFNLATAHLWRCEASDEHITDGLKTVHRSLTTLERVGTPMVSTTQTVAYGIICALEVSRDPGFVSWANNWLSGSDRTESAAAAAARASARAAWPDAAEATASADPAARASARASAWAAAGAWSESAMDAVRAAWEFAETEGDLLPIAKKAMEVK